jgi:hypothetical protein
MKMGLSRRFLLSLKFKLNKEGEHKPPLFSSLIFNENDRLKAEKEKNEVLENSTDSSSDENESGSFFF